MGEKRMQIGNNKGISIGIEPGTLGTDATAHKDSTSEFREKVMEEIRSNNDYTPPRKTSELRMPISLASPEIGTTLSPTSEEHSRPTLAQGQVLPPPRKEIPTISTP